MVGEMDWNVSGQIAGAHVRLNISLDSLGQAEFSGWIVSSAIWTVHPVRFIVYLIRQEQDPDNAISILLM